MLIVDFDGPPSWYLDVNETGESKECLCVRVVKGPPLHPLNRTTSTHGHFVLSQVSLESRHEDNSPPEPNDRHLRSHGKIGYCEQSNSRRLPPTLNSPVRYYTRTWRDVHKYNVILHYGVE